eukprot:6679988-Karenia_brevis.AAC.1
MHGHLWPAASGEHDQPRQLHQIGRVMHGRLWHSKVQHKPTLYLPGPETWTTVRLSHKVRWPH